MVRRFLALLSPPYSPWRSAPRSPPPPSQNMENYGVPPAVYVDNTPAAFLKGRDAQIEKAVQAPKAELAAGRKTTSQQQRH